MTDAVTELRQAMLEGRGFAVPPSPARVRFGVGAFASLPEMLDALGARRALVVASSGRGSLVERVTALLGDRVVAVDTRVAMHVPAALADAVHDDARRLDADIVVAIGGGSAIGMAKAIALAGGPPSIAVPTTYAGSEMTPIWGITRDGAKVTGRDERVRPIAVLYDPTLTLDLPPRVAAPSAINAMAHCVEALYAQDANPLVALFAADGLRALAASAPRVVHDPRELTARTEVLYGAWLAGLALGACTMGLHHKLCHVLGGTFALPHAETHAIMLPYTAAYNASAAPRAMRTVASALGRADDAPRALYEITRAMLIAVGAPTSLRELGVSRDALPRVIAEATARPYPNPRPLDAASVLATLEQAWDGAPPA